MDPGRAQLAAAGLIGIAVCFAYYPSLTGGFILDDDLLLTNNPLVRAGNGLFKIWFTSEPVDYWPVSNSSLWLEWRLWGMNPTGYHVTNLVLHIVTSLLIWAVLQRLLIPGAFFASLLFAVHPVNVETVAWISQRKTLLATLFSLLSVLAYLRSEEEPPPVAWLLAGDRWYGMSLAAFVLALLSKASAATLPLILLGIVFARRALRRADLLRLAPFFVAAVVLVQVNVWFQAHEVEVPVRSAVLVERLLGAAGVLWFYLYKALVPLNLSFLYPQWYIDSSHWVWWLPLLAAAGTSLILWWWRHGWSRWWMMAWGYFGIALVPVMGFTDASYMEHTLVADHYQHAALIGVMALVAAFWGAWQRRVAAPLRWLPNATALALASGLTLLTWQQSALYANPVKLYQATLDTNPTSWLAHNNLGVALTQAGRLPEAIFHYEQVLRLKPDHLEAPYNLGNALAQSGRFDEAIAHYEQGLLRQPERAELHNNLGHALAQTGRLEEALIHYERALQRKSDYPELQNNLGGVLAQAGRLEEAIPRFEEAARLAPDAPAYRNNLGGALAQAGRLADAIVQYRLALQLAPDFAEAHSNLGNALAQGDQLAEAQHHLEQAVRLNPNYPEAHFNLGNVLGQLGKLPQAIAQFQQALQLKPDFAEARRNLEVSLALNQESARQQKVQTP